MQLLPKPEKNSKSQSANLAPDALGGGVFAEPTAPIEAIAPFNRLNDLANDLTERVVILIDGANLFYAASALGIEVDYTKLLYRLTLNRRLVRAYFYTAVDRHNDKQQGFLHWMRRHGYRVVAKDLVQLPDGSKKANVEVEIAIDMLALAPHCDTVILLSGDGDLAYAVNAVAYKGVRVEVFSLFSMTNDDLINVADRYVDLATIKQEIQKGSGPRGSDVA
jgi:uncharacterized LabA/DUF88 family protein